MQSPLLSQLDFDCFFDLHGRAGAPATHPPAPRSQRTFAPATLARASEEKQWGRVAGFPAGKLALGPAIRAALTALLLAQSSVQGRTFLARQPDCVSWRRAPKPARSCVLSPRPADCARRTS